MNGKRIIDFTLFTLSPSRRPRCVMTVLLFLATLVPLYCLGQGIAGLHVIARTGQAGLTTLNDSVSINNNGLVGFSGATAAGRGSFVADASGPRAVFPINDSTRVQQYIQINDGGTIVARRGPFFLTQDPIYYCDPFFGCILIMPGYTDTYDFLQTWKADGSGGITLVQEGRSRVDGETFQFSRIGPFSSVGLNVTINNLGQVAFLADQGVGFNNNYVLATPKTSGYNTVSCWLGAQPMMADDGHIVLRSGSAANSPITLLNFDFTSPLTIASVASGFTALGRMPGISDDGQYVAFYGELSSAGAAALGTSAGPGIFLSVRSSGAWTTMRLAGLTNAAGTVVFNGFDGNQRVGVNRQTQDGQVFTVFAGVDSSGAKGVWACAWNPVNSVSVEFTRVILQSDLIDGTGPFDDFRLVDPINTVGQVAFLARFGNSQAVLQKLLRAGPVVSSLRAEQGPGTNVVEIIYTLADPDSSALTVGLSVSTNGGASFDRPAISRTGDVGSGIVPGPNKKIIWNAGADWPNHFSANVRFRVTAQEEAPPRATTYSDSGRTTVDTRTNTLTVLGRVFDASTRQPLGGARVALAGQSTATAFDGGYALSNVNLSIGNTLSASKSNYATYSGTVPARAGATTVTVPDILLQPGGTNPIVTAVKAKYEGLFLSAASILNEYTALVDWNGTPPGSVEFYINGKHSQTVAATSSEVTATIPMNVGFLGSLNAGANRLTVVAIGAEAERSRPFDQAVTILPTPGFLVDTIALGVFEFLPGNDPILSFDVQFPDKSIPASALQNVPFVGRFGWQMAVGGGFEYALRSGEWNLHAGLTPSGRWKGRAGERPHSSLSNQKFFAGNRDISVELFGQADGTATQTGGIRVQQFGIHFGVDFEQELLAFYLSDFIPGAQWVRVLDALKAVGVNPNSIQRITVYGLLKVESDLYPVLDPPPVHLEAGTLAFGFGAKAAYEPDLIVAKGSIYVGGEIEPEFQIAPAFGFNKINAKIYGGVTFTAFLIKLVDEQFVLVNYNWPNGGKVNSSISNWGTGWMALPVAKRPGDTVPRDHLMNGLERFAVYDAKTRTKASPLSAEMSCLEAFRYVGNATAISPGPKSRQEASASVQIKQADLPLLENVFPSSAPALAGIGKELMLLYVSDNGSSNALQFTDIKWTRWDGTNWSVPQSIRANTQAEFAPQVKFDGTGDAIAVWERVADPNFTNVDLTAMAAQMEIVWSRWSGISGTWTEPVALTANNVLDHAPLLCGPMSDGSVLAVWSRNQANLLMGTNGAGADEVLWARWDAAARSWTGPQTLLSGVAYRLSESLAGADGHAVYAWTQDHDGVLTNDFDQEVLYCEWTNGVWSAARQFTTNAIADKNVRATVATNGTVYLVWQSGTNLVMSRSFSTNVTMVRPDSQTAGFADYAITVGPQGNLVLLWQEMSQDGPDAHCAVYDPVSATWSKDVLLCQDPSLERSFAPVWDDVGNLTVAYNKVELIHTNKTVTLEGGETITITNVPQPGRVDLVVTKRALVKDLALLTGDFTVDGVNWLPGDPLTLTARVRNLGDVAVSNVVVSFFDGDPDSGGVLLTNVTWPGWLEGANTNGVVSALWVVPELAAPHTLYAVVNRTNAFSEYNESNNVQAVPVGGTDLAVSLVSYRAETNGALRVISQVQNLGAPTATNTILAIRRDGQAVTLATAAVPVLEPGRLAQVALDLPAGTQPAGEMVYRLFADDTHLTSDVDTNNNTSAFAVNLWIDSDGDGLPDSWMLEHFGHATGQASDLSRAQDDADGDGMNNLTEYLAGTDPKQARSYLRIAGIDLGGTNGVQITWGSASNKLYSVQRVVALGGALGFTNIAEHILSTPPENAYLDTTATNSPSLFYRVKVE